MCSIECPDEYPETISNDTMNESEQKIPGSGPEREHLRCTGQFWTPAWIAEAMVGYVLAGGSNRIFDPAVGSGAFVRATRTIASEMSRPIRFLGTEIDPEVLHQTRSLIENGDELYVTDFVCHPPEGLHQAIVANPPYIRHHRIAPQRKTELKKIAEGIIGCRLDGRAGLHGYFLIRALQLLDKEGMLAFIMPADICEGVFAPTLWMWITGHYCLDAVITFEPEASPFPNVDTNPIILLIRHRLQTEDFLWVRCLHPQTPQLKAWFCSGLRDQPGPHLQTHRRHIAEGLRTGLSRPFAPEIRDGPVLSDFASVVRGIATGSNEFFFLTAQQARALGIPGEYLIPAIGRTRDAPGDEIALDTIEALAARGRPTLLFCPDGKPVEQFPLPVQEYLHKGEKARLHQKPLLSTRRPWYKMEVRNVPPFLFAYLGRRHARFLRNLAGVIPLTVFLCVYPRQTDMESLDRLWQVLRHPQTIANLRLVGKSYGAGAIKVEPRSLERLPLPECIVKNLFGNDWKN